MQMGQGLEAPESGRWTMAITSASICPSVATTRLTATSLSARRVRENAGRWPRSTQGHRDWQRRRTIFFSAAAHPITCREQNPRVPCRYPSRSGAEAKERCPGHRDQGRLCSVHRSGETACANRVGERTGIQRLSAGRQRHGV